MSHNTWLRGVANKENALISDDRRRGEGPFPFVNDGRGADGQRARAPTPRHGAAKGADPAARSVNDTAPVSFDGGRGTPRGEWLQTLGTGSGHSGVAPNVIRTDPGEASFHIGSFVGPEVELRRLSFRSAPREVQLARLQDACGLSPLGGTMSVGFWMESPPVRLNHRVECRAGDGAFVDMGTIRTPPPSRAMIDEARGNPYAISIRLNAVIPRDSGDVFEVRFTPLLEPLDGPEEPWDEPFILTFPPRRDVSFGRRATHLSRGPRTGGRG